MKKMLKMFSDSLLSKEQMKNVKGGTYYCVCSPGSGPVTNTSGGDCDHFCNGTTTSMFGGGCGSLEAYTNWKVTGNYGC